MKPICKDENSLFYRYLYFVFTPKLINTFKDFDSDSMSGSILVDRSGYHQGRYFNCVYCSPMWEGAVDEIQFEFSDDDGYVNSASVSFPLNGWTMEVDKDVERYVNAVSDFLRVNTVSVK